MKKNITLTHPLSTYKSFFFARYLHSFRNTTNFLFFSKTVFVFFLTLSPYWRLIQLNECIWLSVKLKCCNWTFYIYVKVWHLKVATKLDIVSTIFKKVSAFFNYKQLRVTFFDAFNKSLLLNRLLYGRYR